VPEFIPGKIMKGRVDILSSSHAWFLCSLLFLLFFSLNLSGCFKKERPSSQGVTPAAINQPLPESTPYPETSPPGGTQPLKAAITENSLRNVKAGHSDFTIPLYPGAHQVWSSRSKGFSPLDQSIMMSIMEMYTSDPFDDVLNYYKNEKKVNVMKDFITDEGRKVILSDRKEIIALPSAQGRRGTTLVLSCHKDMTTLVYTSHMESKD
jgi:hypothetical protein